ncbi:hypothetical protein A374_16213 [Fictibacillus macauensis ZFHKF-1]|uniref:Calcineurin-like phosphoesterase domain-containing protein n=1 Tax=Fictibacillus macauensis ZFHKF-1 TaxID=1196324 RepID=I8AFD7_9BACL|nr:metallophosphoesterase [Fictibacillus macauensis]EIT84347.1 hypothetical protein A374_16213 [Fictibacillus macauensis ZFHKF-1]
MKKKTRRLVVLYSTFVLAIAFILYTVYDQHRVAVVKERITLPRLPASFQDFHILQVSDLHGTYFGKEQSRLAQAINSLDYDVIVFTGDMGKKESGTSAIFDLMKHIEKKRGMYWVDGHTKPQAMQRVGGLVTGKLTAFGIELERRGVTVLKEPVAIKRGHDAIWFTPQMSEGTFSLYTPKKTAATIQQFGGEQTFDEVHTYYTHLKKAYNQLKNKTDLKILLSHYPQTASRLSGNDHLPYDFIVAGHLHGGQYRIPGYGAPYVQALQEGAFPVQSHVKGLQTFSSTSQYVSAGLGGSGSLPFLNIRLWNTPEINLLTLSKKSD